jgi:hypothetical protein
MALPIASVYVDIAEFLAETMDVIQENPEESDRALGAWTRRLAKALARRDPSIHPYAAKLLEDAAKFMASKSEKNKAAADERWRKEREKANASNGMHAHADAYERNANNAKERSGRSDQEDHRETPPLPPRGRSREKMASAFQLPDHLQTQPRFVEAWNGYLEMRKKIRKPATDLAMTRIIERLRGLCAASLNVAIAILDQSTRKSWVDVFPLEEHKTNGHTRNTPDPALPYSPLL